MPYRIFELDPALLPYREAIEQRMQRYFDKRRALVGDEGSLSEFANGHEYFGFHKTPVGWVYREWAPAAEEVFLRGDMNGWSFPGERLTPIGNGVFEIHLPPERALFHGCHVQCVIRHNGELLERVPLYITRVEQDKDTNAWCGVIQDDPPYRPKKRSPHRKGPLLIYECHVGMAQEREGIGSYAEFAEVVLPRVKALGYNAIQIMAVMEHPYYGSFGYQVSSFFAPCSRYGTANDLRRLIDKAHGMGLSVLLDVVHSHAVKNTAEGIAAFDGTDYQFFHRGPRGEHPAWGTKLFDYGKHEVIHFLLSNLKYWLTEYGFDGFRFDGVTSMLYHDHGLGTAFTDYGKYFSPNTDTDAVTYLQLANDLIREVRPDAVTVAEDMSAMPGMCLPLEAGGIGFDYRLAMGVPDLWIKLLKEQRDEQFNMWQIWGELTSRRPGEKYVAYTESHDQALVGDKTLMFRLCDSAMYTDMSREVQSLVIDRGMALHKLFRLLTLSLGGEGYLNFMGNEFGHPEWIDFPREGNNWSYFYCRRQWHLADDDALKYGLLQEFDRAMLELTRQRGLFERLPRALAIDADAQVLVYERGGLIFAVNMSPTRSYEGYWLPVPRAGAYRAVLSTDAADFGGWDRIGTAAPYPATKQPDGAARLQIYLPARTAVVLKRSLKKGE